MAQSKAQQKCITAFGTAAAGLVKARAAENARCLEAFGKDQLGKLGAPSLRSCLARDAKGKLAKQAAKLTRAEEVTCLGAEPDFGIGPGGASQVARLAETQATGLVLDLLSENLFATARTCEQDPAGCKCQALVLGGAADLASANLEEFGRCAKQALKQGAAGAAALGACLTDVGLPGSVAADSKGKLVRRVEKLTGSIEKKCSGVSEPVFPGECPTAAGEDLSNCAERDRALPRVPRAERDPRPRGGLRSLRRLRAGRELPGRCRRGGDALDRRATPRRPRRRARRGSSSRARSCSRSSGAAAST